MTLFWTGSRGSQVSQAPDFMPVLSRGKHRSARRGACFMEMASVLASERWSDHPSCTHPLLAHLARLVNDHTSDDQRHLLAPMIPSVVGLHGDGLPFVVRVSTRVAVHAIAQVPEPAQRALAAGLHRADQAAAGLGPDLADTREEIREALETVPGAVAWLRRFGSQEATVTSDVYAARCAPTMVRCSVQGITATGASDVDDRLRGLLEVGIAAGLRPDPSLGAAAPLSRPVVRTSRRIGQPG